MLSICWRFCSDIAQLELIELGGGARGLLSLKLILRLIKEMKLSLRSSLGGGLRKSTVSKVPMGIDCLNVVGDLERGVGDFGGVEGVRAFSLSLIFSSLSFSSRELFSIIVLR
jgi:hypothetical protein